MSFQVDFIDSRNSEKKNKKVVKTTKVVCAKCSRKLGDMIEAEPKLKNDTELKHIFVCPCGGESFTVKVKYTAFFLAEENLVTTSVVDIGTNKFKSKLETHNGE